MLVKAFSLVAGVSYDWFDVTKSQTNFTDKNGNYVRTDDLTKPDVKDGALRKEPGFVNHIGHLHVLTDTELQSCYSHAELTETARVCPEVGGVLRMNPVAAQDWAAGIGVAPLPEKKRFRTLRSNWR